MKRPDLQTALRRLPEIHDCVVGYDLPRYFEGLRMRSRRSASCSPVVIFCRLSLIAVAIHSGRNQTCLTRLTIDWPMSFNSCTTWPNAVVISDLLTARFGSIGLLDRGGDNEPFA